MTPNLRRGYVLVLDSLPVHYLPGLREWLSRCGMCVLFLSPYFPDFSPIEQAWNKPKTKLRACAARHHETLEEALPETIDWVSNKTL